MRRRLQGIIVSQKMKNTAVVRVERMKLHPKYQKRYRVSQQYKAQVDPTKYQVGDKVMMEETRPISKDKRWRIVSKV